MAKLNSILATKLPGFTLCGDFIFLEKKSDIAGGVSLEETPSGYYLIIWQLPLFQKWNFIHTAFADRIFLAEKSTAISELVTVAVNVTQARLPELEKRVTHEGFLRAYSGMPVRDIRLLQALALSAYLAGDEAMWLELCGKIQSFDCASERDIKAVNLFRQASSDESGIDTLVEKNTRENIQLPIPLFFKSTL